MAFDSPLIQYDFVCYVPAPSNHQTYYIINFSILTDINEKFMCKRESNIQSKIITAMRSQCKILLRNAFSMQSGTRECVENAK